MNLFDLDIEEDEVVEEQRRKKQPYKEATIRPPTMQEAMSNIDNLFGDDLIDKTPLSEMYISQAEVLEIQGTNGLKSISAFSGCGGSMTGFAWAGWGEAMAIEFVDAARNTHSSNYPSSIIEPIDVLKVARKVAKKMDLSEFVGSIEKLPENFKGIVVNKSRKTKGKAIAESLNWEATLLSLGGKKAEKFRSKVCDKTIQKHVEGIGKLFSAEMVIWGDDIRGIDPTVILAHLGMKRGELDCFEGSPPCKSFSTSGIREQGWGKVLHYSDERNQRTDDLFLEYFRLLDGFLPKSFIAENVAGISMGTAEQDVMVPFIEACTDLGYTVSAKLMSSKDYGVPQDRPRVIFQGIRNDLQDKRTGRIAIPKWPSEWATSYTVRDALEAADGLNTPEGLARADLTKYETGKIWNSLPIGGSPENKAYQLVRCHPDRPSPTITATSAGNQPAAGPCHPFECRKFTIPEYRYLFGFPHDYNFTGTIDQQGERMGRCVPPYMMKQIAECVADVLLNSESVGEVTTRYR